MTSEEMLARIRQLEEEALASARAAVPFKAKVAMALLGCVLLAAAACAGYYYLKHDQVVTVSQEQLKNTEELAAALKLSKQTAAELQKAVQEAQNRPAVITYTVQAPSVEKAAVEVKKQLDAGLSPANKIPADKTVVTPNTDQQKVDVYRITLDKPRGAGVYVSSESAGAMLQYRNVVLFAGPKYHGGYEVGAAYMVRW